MGARYSANCLLLVMCSGRLLILLLVASRLPRAWPTGLLASVPVRRLLAGVPASRCRRANPSSGHGTPGAAPPNGALPLCGDFHRAHACDRPRSLHLIFVVSAHHGSWVVVSSHARTMQQLLWSCTLLGKSGERVADPLLVYTPFRLECLRV